MTISIHILPALILILLTGLTWIFYKVSENSLSHQFFALLNGLCFLINIIWYTVLLISWLNENITITF